MIIINVILETVKNEKKKEKKKGKRKTVLLGHFINEPQFTQLKLINTFFTLKYIHAESKFNKSTSYYIDILLTLKFLCTHKYILHAYIHVTC